MNQREILYGGRMSQRQLRVGELIRAAIVEVFQRGGLRDPMLKDISITVCEVRPSADLKVARIYVFPLGGGQEANIVEALTRAAPYLRREVTKLVKLKFSPELRFELDPTFDEAQHIDNLLDGVSISEQDTSQHS